jgi:hypothetical protein
MERTWHGGSQIHVCGLAASPALSGFPSHRTQLLHGEDRARHRHPFRHHGPAGESDPELAPVSADSVLQQFGEGGCGVVWMAEQREPVRRRVAVKVIKLGMDTKAVVARSIR